MTGFPPSQARSMGRHFAADTIKEFPRQRVFGEGVVVLDGS
jgi:hypothetical protein